MELQQADREILRLNQEIAALPKRVAAIEEKLAGTKAGLERAKAAVKADEATKRKHESAIQDLQGKISKYRDQSLAVKTNEQYKALLVKLDKRFARRYAFTASYALSSLRGFDYTRDLNNLFGNSGYLNADARHVFALNSVLDLPYGFQAGFIANLNSSQPFSATLNGLPADTDINGDGTGNDLLPGFGFNKGNRGISVSDLRRLVDAYNQNFAGKTTPRGGTMPTVTLPSNYQFGDIFQSYDARLSKNFKLYQEKLALELIAEVFNMFNISNKTGFSNRLDSSFGQATSKAGQAFGFGGPRAWQFAGRIKF